MLLELSLWIPETKVGLSIEPVYDLVVFRASLAHRVNLSGLPGLIVGAFIRRRYELNLVDSESVDDLRTLSEALDLLCEA